MLAARPAVRSLLDYFQILEDLVRAEASPLSEFLAWCEKSDSIIELSFSKIKLSFFGGGCGVPSFGDPLIHTNEGIVPLSLTSKPNVFAK